MKITEVKALLRPLAVHTARLEVLVAEMVQRDLLKLDELEFRAASTFARNYSRDIGLAEIADYPGGEALRLTTHREGLYDQLPYGLFHRPEPYYPGQKLDDRIKETEAARERETVARSFFHPFEQLFFRTAIKSELLERHLLDEFTSPLRQRLLLALWPHCTRVRAQSLSLLSYVLPLSYKIAGDLSLMTISYQAVLRLPVVIQYVSPARTTRGKAPLSPAGNRLGQNFTLGGVPPAELPELEIIIGPLGIRQADDFLPGAPLALLLELLNDCLVPLEVDVRQRLLFQPEIETFVLGSPTEEGARLGFTSRIPELV